MPLEASIMPMHFDSLYALLEGGSSKELEQFLMKLRLAMNTDVYPKHNAISYRKHLQLLLTALLSKTEARVSSPLNQNNLVIVTAHRRWCIECLNDHETKVNLEPKHSPSIIVES